LVRLQIAVANDAEKRSLQAQSGPFPVLQRNKFCCRKFSQFAIFAYEINNLPIKHTFFWSKS